MSVNTETQSVQGNTTVLDNNPDSVYASLFEKINLNPVSRLGDITEYQDDSVMADASADERVTAAIQVFMQVISKSGQKVEKLDKSLLDSHIAELDYQISRQLDEVMHHPDFQRVESLWRGLKHTVDRTDFRQNVKIEILDVSKDDLRQDFEDAPEIIQSGLYPVVFSIPIYWSCCAFISATAVTPDCVSPYLYGYCLSLALAKAGVSSWAVPVCLALKLASSAITGRA